MVYSLGKMILADSYTTWGKDISLSQALFNFSVSPKRGGEKLRNAGKGHSTATQAPQKTDLIIRLWNVSPPRLLITTPTGSPIILDNT